MSSRSVVLRDPQVVRIFTPTQLQLLRIEPTEDHMGSLRASWRTIAIRPTSSWKGFYIHSATNITEAVVKIMGNCQMSFWEVHSVLFGILYTVHFEPFTVFLYFIEPFYLKKRNKNIIHLEELNFCTGRNFFFLSSPTCSLSPTKRFSP